MELRRIAINLTSRDGEVDIAVVDMVPDIKEAMLILSDLWGRANVAERRIAGEELGPLDALDERASQWPEDLKENGDHERNGN